MDWRPVVGLEFQFMEKRRSIRIMDQNPRPVGDERRREHGKLHRLRISRAGVQVVRHRDDRKQKADHARERHQGYRGTLMSGAPKPQPQQQQNSGDACPDKIEYEFHSFAKLRIC